MSRLRITPRAVTDLEQIGDYIARHNPPAALRLISRLENLSKLLSEHPHIGVLRTDIAADMRIFTAGNYLILFRSFGDGVEVIRYVHAARHLQDLV